VRVHVREQAEDYKRLGERFGVQWTPTILELDSQGQERHRIEGFLSKNDFLTQLMVGLGHAAFEREEWAGVQRAFHEALERDPHGDTAPEALYWEGVARYKATKNSAALAETARALAQRFAGATWTKKASIWAPV